MIGEEALIIGPVTVSYLDADALSAADYRIELSLWPGGRIVLTHLGRRFDTFAQELRMVRNEARVAGLLAHGITRPRTFDGAVLSDGQQSPTQLQLYDTHLTVVPQGDDPWQLPFGALTDLRSQPSPPALVLETPEGLTTVGQLARQREACEAEICERRDRQRRTLAELTGQAGFADGLGVPRSRIRGYDVVSTQFTAPERLTGSRTLLDRATAEPRFGFVQLLDPEGERLRCPAQLPDNWAVFLLVPYGALTVLELLAGPAAATYAFRADIDTVNRDLQLLHFRRAPLALTAEQAVVTPSNPHRLALRRLEPLRRLRANMVARIIHNDAWAAGLWSALERERGE